MYPINISSIKQHIIAFLAIMCCLFQQAFAQIDTTIDNANYRLPEVVVSNIDIPQLLHRIQNDTSFYKAFKSLHIVGYTSHNKINVLRKNSTIKASYESTVQQLRQGDCRWDKVLSQNSTGDFFDKKGRYNYTIGELYDKLFFVDGKACGETNIVAGAQFKTGGKSGIAKKKEQLKMLFFNPGKKIPGIPFIGDKLDLYDAAAKEKYNYTLETTIYNGVDAYIFTIKPKPGASGVVVDEMRTVFEAKTLDVLSRSYALSYKAGVYDFDVKMQVELKHINGMLLPVSMTYIGNWDILFKKREIATFAAKLYNFKD